MKSFLGSLLAVVFLVAAIMNPVQAEVKQKIEKLDDLPRHTYKIEMKAVELIDNDAALMKLAGEVKQDLLDDLNKFEI